MRRLICVGLWWGLVVDLRRLRDHTLSRDVAGGRGTQRGSLSTPTRLGSGGDEGFSQVCGTVRNMIDALYEALPQVRALIDAGRIRLQDFEHSIQRLRYNLLVIFKLHILKIITGWGLLLYMPACTKACTVFCEIHTALGTSLS